MNLSVARVRRQKERGVALLLAMFALLLLSAIGVFMYLSSGTEARIDANYGSSLNAYYAARYGLEEVRDRIKYSSVANPPVGGIAELLPKDIAGNPGGVLYVLNPSNGEVVDPTNTANPYFDDQLCHDYNSGVPKSAKCTVVPGIANWNLAPLTSLAAPGTAVPFKWVRINMKTNRIADPFFVDASNLPASLDQQVCWDGQGEQLSPGGANPSCDANGMQNVYMLTSLAVSTGLRDNAARRMLRFEVVAPSIRPPGAITMDAASVAPTFSNGGIPTTAIDGRVHNTDGTLATGGRCSAVAAVATDSSQTASQLMQGLNNLRQSIVQTANNSCNADGSPAGSNACTPGLWWVRGTDLSPRFVLTTTTTSSSSDGHDGSHSGSTTTTTCDSTNAACFTNLNLTSPELMAVQAFYSPHIPSVVLPANPSGPFTGLPGNQADPAVYEAPSGNTLPNEVQTISALVSMSSGQSGYTATSAANLAASYGSSTSPAIVVITDSSLVLTNTSLTGFGVLVVANDLEISNATLNWTGIVMVQGGGAKFVVGQNANGFINGALMLQPSGNNTANVQTSTSASSSFRLTYSCDAIDMAFAALPLKIVSSSESSF